MKVGSYLLLFFALSVGCASTENAALSGSATVVWLPIVATHSHISDSLNKAIDLQRYGSRLILVSTDDCRNLRHGLYLVVAGIQNTPTAAESAAASWRHKGVHDAYWRRCKVVVPSRLSLGIPLLDPSFMKNRLTAINWTADDAVSRIVILSGHWVAAVIPRYDYDPEDIREGLRIGVRLYDLHDNRSLPLASDCIDPDFAMSPSHLALSCVSETAGTHLLHRIFVFELNDAHLVAQARHCRKPVYQKGHWICQRESVDADGVLSLMPFTIELP